MVKPSESITILLVIISAYVTQVYIYRTNPCGNNAISCQRLNGGSITANISVWVQLIL
ncbi:hypothetical protein N431DRAFT_209255 [Stipitochalara longipes BDJ]|nr:hypothetical protein N431DRAFT_209255 [Stipitochalara longipes BDJ]